MNLDEPFMTTADVARLLNVATSTVRCWRYTGTGPQAYQVGKHLRYRRSDVEAWLAEAKQRAGRAS